MQYAKVSPENTKGVVAALIMGDPLLIEPLIQRVLQASRKLAQPIHFLDSDTSQLPIAPHVFWIGLIGQPSSELRGKVAKTILQLRSCWLDAPFVITFDRPPDQVFSELIQHNCHSAIFSDPNLFAIHATAGRELWVGAVQELEQRAQRDTSSKATSRVDYHGAIRFVKLLKWMIAHPHTPPSSPINMPLKAMVEVVRACNLKCPLCPVGNGEAHRYPHMRLELFDTITRAISPTVWKIILYNYGEPLLHPQITEIVRTSKRNNIECVEICTNGNILRPGVSEGLVAEGLDLLKVSIDAATQETYARYRVGGNLDNVLENIKRVRRDRELAGRNTPVIEAQFVVSRFNQHEADEFKHLMTDIGVDRVRFKTFNAYMSGGKFLNTGREFLPLETANSRYTDYESLSIRDEFKLAHCSWPWEELVVNADGSIVPCCYDYNGLHTLGDFTSGNEWWHTLARSNFRERLQQAPLSIEMCARCPVGIPDLGINHVT